MLVINYELGQYCPNRLVGETAMKLADCFVLLKEGCLSGKILRGRCSPYVIFSFVA